MDTIDLNSGNAQTEYHSVDISTLPGSNGLASEPQLMPITSGSEATTDDLSFVSLRVDTHGTAGQEQVEGDIDAGRTLSSDEMGYMQSESRHRGKGRTSQFLESKGFGWLLEVEEDDKEEENRPLLLVCM